MNSFLISLSPVKNVVITGDNYSIEIHKSFSEIFPEINVDDFRVSSFFEYFFENNFLIDEEKNYKIMITIKKSEYFSQIIQKLFRKALNKEIILINGKEFKIKGIISNDKIWTGYYNLEEIMKKDQEELCSSFKMKILTPIFDRTEGKFIFGFDKIFNKILEAFSEYCGKDLSWMIDQKENFFIVRKEKYYTKDMPINGIIKNSYVGEIDIEILEKQYKNLIYAIFIFAKFNGIGDDSNYGFGQILIKI